MQLNDKTVIITGASSGIGAAAALLFAMEGANLVLGARREDELMSIMGQINQSNGRAICLPGDVGDEDFVRALVEMAENTYGGLDAALNNAGMMGDAVPVPDMSSDNWDAVLKTNLTSAFYAAKYQVPAMKRTGAGSIIFTSSFVGYTAAFPGMATDEHILKIARLLPDVVGAEDQNVVLYFLLETSASAAAKNWPALETLVMDDNDIIRHRAIRVAVDGKSEAALRSFVATGWVAKEEHSRDENAYGSLALSCAADLFDDPALLDRADPEIWGRRIQHTEDKELSLDKFHGFLRERVSGEDKRKTRSFPRLAWDHKDAVRTLIAERGTEFLEWFTPWLDGRDELPRSSLYETFPFIDLARALIEKGHSEGEHLWAKLVKAEKAGIHKSSDLHFFPLFSPDLTEESQFRDAVPDFLTTDAKIRDFVWFAFKANRSEWLADLIREDVVADSAYRQARGWQLLGYSDSDKLFCGLWEELDGYRPLQGWLRDVANRAEKEFKRNKWAQHWYKLHIKSTDAVTAYTAFQLMARCIDDRSRLWMQKEPIHTGPLKNIIQSHWELNYETLNNGIKDRKKNEKEQLFGLTTTRHTQAPWF